MGCKSIAGLPPALNSPAPIYTPGWREALRELSVLPKNTTQCLRPELEPRQLDSETNALTTRPPCLHSGNMNVPYTLVNGTIIALQVYAHTVVHQASLHVQLLLTFFS